MSALAVLALGAGAMGFAASVEPVEEMRSGAAKVARRTGLPPGMPARSADRSVRVERGDELTAVLLAAGVGGLDAALAGRLGSDVTGSVDIWFGARVGPDKRALERLEVRQPGRLLAIERRGDDFARRELAGVVDDTPVRIRLGGAELATGLITAGIPRHQRDDLLDLIAGERPAAIDLIIAHEAGTYGSRYGAPLYLGAYLRDGSIKRWVGGGKALRALGGEEGTPAGLLRPLPGAVTSTPGLRFHPILRYLRWHRGTDFASPFGTPVQAALGGQVIAAGWQGGYGRRIRIAHADGSSTLYAHLSTLAVREGEEVARGTVIGRVGETGLATGPHLHFEWQRGGATLTPRFAAGQIADLAIGSEQRAGLRALLSAPFRLPPDRSS